MVIVRKHGPEDEPQARLAERSWPPPRLIATPGFAGPGCAGSAMES